MKELLQMRLRQYVTRRLITAGIVATALTAGGVIASPLIGGWHLEYLTNQHQSTRVEMTAAQEAVVSAQAAFQAEAERALPLDSTLATFIGAINSDLLSDTNALDDLLRVRGDIAQGAGIHEIRDSQNVKVVFQPALAPRLPAETHPSTISGLNFAIDRNRKVVSEYDGAAKDFASQAANVADNITLSRDLMEGVLASAAKYATSREMLKYTKADVLVKVSYNRVVGELDDESIEPLARYSAFASAVKELRDSHVRGVADEERLELEKVKAAEKARIAAEEAEKKAEQERLALEEAERKKSELLATPTPVPTPTPTKPQSTPTPTPTESPPE